MARPTLHGEVWWAELDKKRPAVVVSRDDGRGVRLRTTVAPVTTRIREIPSEVELGAADGLETRSAVNCDELVTIPKDLLVRRIGRLSAEQIGHLDRALTFAFGLRQQR